MRIKNGGARPILCMVLALCPVTAFADEGIYTVTLNFKYGTHPYAGDEPSPHVFSVKPRKLKGPIYRKGQTGGNERWLGINENTTRNICHSPDCHG